MTSPILFKQVVWVTDNELQANLVFLTFKNLEIPIFICGSEEDLKVALDDLKPDLCVIDCPVDYKELDRSLVEVLDGFDQNLLFVVDGDKMFIPPEIKNYKFLKKPLHGTRLFQQVTRATMGLL